MSPLCSNDLAESSQHSSCSGANPSAEEGGEDLDDSATTVNNVVHSFRLQSTAFDKKSFLTYLKGYMKTVKEKLQETNPDRVAEFEKGAQGFAKKLVANFKDYEFVRVNVAVARSQDLFTLILHVCIVHWREDGP